MRIFFFQFVLNLIAFGFENKLTVGKFQIKERKIFKGETEKIISFNLKEKNDFIQCSLECLKQSNCKVALVDKNECILFKSCWPKISNPKNFIFKEQCNQQGKNYKVNLLLKNHTNAIRSLVILPNGDLASASIDKTIKIWNISDGTLKASLNNHSGSVYSLVVLPNGNLASGSSDNSIIIWNITNKLITGILKNHTRDVRTLVITPNGNLASGSLDGTIKIWNIKNYSLLMDFSNSSEPIYSLVVLPNGDLASGSNQSITIWNPQ